MSTVLLKIFNIEHRMPKPPAALLYATGAVLRYRFSEQALFIQNPGYTDSYQRANRHQYSD
jgi:hypothetical protein